MAAPHVAADESEALSPVRCVVPVPPFYLLFEFFLDESASEEKVSSFPFVRHPFPFFSLVPLLIVTVGAFRFWPLCAVLSSVLSLWAFTPFFRGDFAVTLFPENLGPAALPRRSL